MATVGTSLTIDQYIAMSASIGALLAAMATFWTVREMAQQRRTTYMPDLVMPKVFLKGGPARGAFSLADSWSDKEVDGKPRKARILELANIGLGAARNVSIGWYFPFEVYLPRLRDYARAAGIELMMEFSDCRFQLDGAVCFWDSADRTQLDYILPSAEAKNSSEIWLPSPFLWYVSTALYSFIAPNDMSGERLVALKRLLHPLRVEITYEDIGGVVSTRTFRVAPNIMQLSQDKCQIMLEAKKVS